MVEKRGKKFLKKFKLDYKLLTFVLIALIVAGSVFAGYKIRGLEQELAEGKEANLALTSVLVDTQDKYLELKDSCEQAYVKIEEFETEIIKLQNRLGSETKPS